MLHKYHQIKPYLNSVDDTYEFRETESYVQLHILDNERENVLRLQFLNCSCIMDLVLRMPTSICIAHPSAQLCVSSNSFKQHKMNQLLRKKNK